MRSGEWRGWRLQLVGWVERSDACRRIVLSRFCFTPSSAALFSNPRLSRLYAGVDSVGTLLACGDQTTGGPLIVDR